MHIIAIICDYDEADADAIAIAVVVVVVVVVGFYIILHSIPESYCIRFQPIEYPSDVNCTTIIICHVKLSSEDSHRNLLMPFKSAYRKITAHKLENFIFYIYLYIYIISQIY